MSTPADEPGARAAYARFLVGTGSWFLVWGMQTVVFQWLVVEVLRESPARVGAAQTAMLVPAVLLLLPGGAVADRFDRTRLLLGAHALSALLYAALAATVAWGVLRYSGLLAFACALGALQALQVPAREGQLHEVAGGFLARAVVGSNLAQQGGQAVGGLLAGVASVLGAPLVLLGQALLTAAGALPLLGLEAGAPAGARAGPALAALREGVRVALGDRVLRGTFLLTTAVGLLFVGPYAVVLPLLVRDFYGGGPREMGILAAMLPLGGMAAGLVLFVRGGIRGMARALFAGQAFSALCIGAIGLAPPFAGAALCVLGWGAGSAYFLNAGRTLFHQRVTDATRGKALAVYSFGILGAGPVGALLSGFLVELLGAPVTLVAQGAAMLVGVALVRASGMLRGAG